MLHGPRLVVWLVKSTDKSPLSCHRGTCKPRPAEKSNVYHGQCWYISDCRLFYSISRGSKPRIIRSHVVCASPGSHSQSRVNAYCCMNAYRRRAFVGDDHRKAVKSRTAVRCGQRPSSFYRAASYTVALLMKAHVPRCGQYSTPTPTMRHTSCIHTLTRVCITAGILYLPWYIQQHLFPPYPNAAPGRYRTAPPWTAEKHATSRRRFSVSSCLWLGQGYISSLAALESDVVLTSYYLPPVLVAPVGSSLALGRITNCSRRRAHTPESPSKK